MKIALRISVLNASHNLRIIPLRVRVLRPVFSYRLRHIVGFGLFEVVISLPRSTSSIDKNLLQLVKSKSLHIYPFTPLGSVAQSQNTMHPMIDQ